MLHLRVVEERPEVGVDNDELCDAEGFVGDVPAAVRRYRFRHPTARSSSE